MNLAEETLAILSKHEKTKNDIAWVGGNDFEIDKDLFWKLSDKMYDSGFGGQEVASDLIICGNDWWLERHEYDGSEWWEYKTVPSKPIENKSISTLFAHIGWSALKECQRGDE